MLGQGAPSSIEEQGAHEQGAHHFNNPRFKRFNATWGKVPTRHGPLAPSVAPEVPSGDVATSSVSALLPSAGFHRTSIREKSDRSPGGSPASKILKSLGGPSPIPHDLDVDHFLDQPLGQVWGHESSAMQGGPPPPPYKFQFAQQPSGRYRSKTPTASSKR